MIQHIRLHFFRISDKFMSFYYNIRVAYLQKKKYIYIYLHLLMLFSLAMESLFSYLIKENYLASNAYKSYLSSIPSRSVTFSSC